MGLFAYLELYPFSFELHIDLIIMANSIIDALTSSADAQTADAIAALVDGVITPEQEYLLRQRIAALGGDPDSGLIEIRNFASTGMRSSPPPISKSTRSGFHPEVENLMRHSLTDNVLTNAELSVIRKKAVAFGDDPDEVIMVLESRLNQKHKDENKAKKPSGECPSCGDMIRGFSRVCASCGHMLDDSVSSSSQELDSSIKELEGYIVKLNGFPKASLGGYILKALKVYLIIAFTLGLYWLFKKSTNNKPNDTGDWDSTVLTAKQAIRRIGLKFGQDPQVKGLLGELESEINAEIQVREKARKATRMGLIGVVILFLLMSLIGGE